eukprot:jgi/Pico_ML_1/53822/g4297.t1
MEEKRNRTTGAEFQFVVITSASQPRGQYNYLLRTVLKLVNVLGQDPSSHVAVLDVGPDDPQVQMISDLVPVRRTSTELDGEGMLQHRKYLGKQLKDYASALGLCVESQARYCCVLEDDVIVSTHLLPILRILLGRIERKHRPSILYPNEVAGELQEFLLDLLRNGSVLASDIAVGEFMTVQHLPTYLAVPNLLDHIGFVSTNLMKILLKKFRQRMFLVFVRIDTFHL